MRSRHKNIVTLLFLAIFLSVRIGNAHAIFHLDEDVDTVKCELCEYISLSEEVTPININSGFESNIDVNVYSENNERLFSYEEPVFWIVSPRFVLNKPPPRHISGL